MGIPAAMTILNSRSFSAFALALSLTAGPGFADTETEHAEVAHEMAEMPMAPKGPDSVPLVTDMALAAAKLEQLAFEVLAEDGDRDTAHARQEISIWASALSDMLSHDAPRLQAASDALYRAETRYLIADDTARTGVDALVINAMNDIRHFEEEGLPENVSAKLSEIADVIAELDAVSTWVEPTRPLAIDLSFEENFSEEERAAFLARLLTIGEETGILVEYDPADAESAIHMTGTAPASLTSLELKTALERIWNPPVPDTTGAGETMAAPEISAPYFIGITLN